MFRQDGKTHARIGGWRALCLLALLTSGGSVWGADAYTQGTIRLERAQQYLDEIMLAPDCEFPKEMLEEARGIIILRQYRGGLGIGFKGGTGVALLKDEVTGQWSPPVFLRSGELSIGWQIGGQSIDTIYFVMNQDGVEMLLRTKAKIGVGASAAAGTVGRDAEAEVGAKTAMVGYSRSQGLYAGATLEGGGVVVDEEVNRAFYGDAFTDVRTILIERAAPMPPEAQSLVARLNRYEDPNYVCQGSLPETTSSAGPVRTYEPATSTEADRASAPAGLETDESMVARYRLENLRTLRDENLLTEDEYQAMRQRVLDRYFG